jgi:hypothetical protein
MVSRGQERVATAPRLTQESGDAVSLWTLNKERRELVCLAVYLPIGVDVRLMEGMDFRRTRLVRDAIECTAVSDDWKTEVGRAGIGNLVPSRRKEREPKETNCM